MADQITRKNHYVPQWYQWGFLSKGQHKLHVLNMLPPIEVAGRPAIRNQQIEFKGPRQLFQAFDLYTTSFGEKLNDEVERFLFGAIDTNGALAIRAWIDGDEVQMHKRFQDFFSYLDAQKLRTPKGLDWILRQYRSLSQLDLMIEMQRLRTMHATMWTECVREIVSAKESTVKFLISDHPVTVYHGDLAPDSPECQYPADPGIELVGSQTLFGAALAEALARFGRIDTLCHIAGGFRMGEAVHETSPANWDFLFDLNARSLVNVASVVPHMIERGCGRIVTVGAGAALRGSATMGAYCASKSALIRLTEAMSAELKDKSINVNCVLPSIIDTPENRSAMPDADPSRWVAPDALADVIAFLSSDAARAVHGASLPVAALV